MATKVEIANRCLQHLGAKRIVSLDEDSRNGRSVSAAFEPIKLAELRKHPWSFAARRVQLAEDSTPPAFGKTTSYTLPADFVRLLNPDPDFNFNDLDWQIEGRKLLTNDTGPLNFRYIYDVTDPNEMDPLFRETFSAALALALAEEITQSNSKIANIEALYTKSITEAKKANAFERVALQAPTDPWITIRR